MLALTPAVLAIHTLCLAQTCPLACDTTVLDTVVPPPGNSSNFGETVIATDDWLLVGNSLTGIGGQVYVYERVADEWVFLQSLTGSQVQGGGLFARSLALDGDTIAVGAPHESADFNQGGAVYVFEYDGATWAETQRLTAADLFVGDRFGSGVALTGDRMIVGAETAGSLPGDAYAFAFDGASWVETQKIIPTATQGGDRYGARVALDGDTALISAPLFDDDGVTDAGRVDVLTWDGAQWVESASLAPAAPASGADFGRALKLAAGEAFIGAPGTGAGRVHRFAESGGSWEETAPYTPLDPVAAMEFGSAIDFADGQLLVGAPGPDATGSVHLFVPTLLGLKEGVFEPPPVSGNSWGAGVAFGPGDELLASSFGEITVNNGVVTAFATDCSEPACAVPCQGEAELLSHLVINPDGQEINDIAVRGDLMAVVLGEEEAVDVYRLIGQDWAFEQRLVAAESNAQSGNFTDDSHVAIDHNRILVTRDDDAFSTPGRVYVFEYQDAMWRLASAISVHANDPDRNSFAGEVTLDGNLLGVESVGWWANIDGYWQRVQAGGSGFVSDDLIVMHFGGSFGAVTSRHLGGFAPDSFTTISHSIAGSSFDIEDDLIASGTPAVHRAFVNGPDDFGVEQLVEFTPPPGVTGLGSSVSLAGRRALVSAPSSGPVPARGVVVLYEFETAPPASAALLATIPNPAVELGLDGTVTFMGAEIDFDGRYATIIADGNNDAAPVIVYRYRLGADPLITAQPADTPVALGDTATLNVGVEGPAPITYTWYADGVALEDGGRISGSNTPTLQIANVEPEDFTTIYDVVVANDCTLRLSDPAMLSEQPCLDVTNDCDGDGLDDACAIAMGLAQDCNLNGVPDPCEPPTADCDGDGVPDACQILQGRAADCNNNGIPDLCEIAQGPESLDWNLNGLLDACEDLDEDDDLDGNGVFDEAEDCDGNGLPDGIDIAEGMAEDCNLNGVPDGCEMLGAGGDDCNADGITNLEEICSGAAEDCNGNGVPDGCDGLAIHPYEIAHWVTQDAVGPLASTQFLWINRYQVAPNAGVIAGVSVAWSQHYAARPVQIVVFRDPVGDGLATDAELALSHDHTPPDQVGFRFTTVPLPPTFVGEPGDYFFVGVFVEVAEHEPLYAPMDWTSQSLDTWSGLGGNDFPLIDLTDLSTAEVRPMLDYGFPGEWLIAPLLTGDCNDNGAFDGCELADGELTDANGDGIPDDCALPPCAADLDRNGAIGSTDLNLLLVSFGQTASGDVDGDGDTDSLDLNLLLASFGDDCP